MKPKARTHIDGVGDGLSIALTILARAPTVHLARVDVTACLLKAREAKNVDTLAKLGLDFQELRVNGGRRGR